MITDRAPQRTAPAGRCRTTRGLPKRIPGQALATEIGTATAVVQGRAPWEPDSWFQPHRPLNGASPKDQPRPRYVATAAVPRSFRVPQPRRPS